jgi:hypothetical protein
MSNATPFALGLGGGLALWQLLRPSAPPAAMTTNSTSTTAPNTPASSGASSANTPRNNAACLVRIDAAGLTIDGTRVEIAEAVRRCQLAGRALVAVGKDAPASAYAQLMAALRAAGVATQARAAAMVARNAAPQTKEFFSLVTYPRGIEDKPTIRYFRAEQPIAWTEARDRLAAAGLLDLALAGRTREPGGWMLSIDPNDFRAQRAEPLPGGARNSVISTQFTLVTYPEGVGGPKKLRWFRSERPILWDQARDRLAEAGLLDFSANRPLQPGYWILVTSPQAFNDAKAEPLPRPRRRGAVRATQRYTTEGRRILRDGEPILHVDRVDLGDGRYAISPHHADLLTERMVRLLNKHGARS